MCARARLAEKREAACSCLPRCGRPSPSLYFWLEPRHEWQKPQLLWHIAKWSAPNSSPPKDLSLPSSLPSTGYPGKLLSTNQLRKAGECVCKLEKRLAYSKFVSLFTFIALALPSSGRAQEENGKISQTLTTQNSSLVQIISTLYFESKRICFIPLFCWISQQFNIMGCRNLNIATEIPYVPTARLCDWLIDGRALLFLQLQPALARASLWHWWQMREWNSCMIE